MSKKKEERKKIEKKKWKIILHGIQISKHVKKLSDQFFLMYKSDHLEQDKVNSHHMHVVFSETCNVNLSYRYCTTWETKHGVK